MPIVRVDIPEGFSSNTKDALREEIKQAIDEIIDPSQAGRFPETRKWIYVSVREGYGKLGDGLPTVTIDTRPGRKQGQKLRLANALCDIFHRLVGSRDVYVLFRSTEAVDHIGGGVSLPEWKPPAASA